MVINWYKITNETEFLATGLTSREVELVLQNIGQKKILITRGNATSVLYDDVFLTIGLNNRNPARLGEHYVFIDDLSDIYLGIQSDD